MTKITEMTEKIFVGLCTIVFASLSPIFIHFYVLTDDKVYLFYTFCVFMLSFYFQIKLFKRSKELSIIYPLLSISTILFVCIVGFLYFKESITHTKIIGILFGIISLFVLGK